MKENIDFSRVAQAVEARITKRVLAGATLCVQIGGERVYEYTGGYADSGISLRKNALFRLASMTKPITAAAVLLLQDRGKLSVSDKVSRYFPAFAHMRLGRLSDEGAVISEEYAAREMTIEHILNHSSGLGSGAVGDAQWAAAGTMPAALQERARFFGEWALDFTPDTNQQYSPVVALDVAAAIVEQAADCDYQTFLQRELFAPLGMVDTVFAPTDEQFARVVAMYRLNNKARGISRTPMGREGHAGMPVGYVSGCTGLFGTVDDYARFAQMLADGGEFGGVRLLSRQAVQAMRTPRRAHGCAGMDDFSDWGYTVRVRHRAQEGVQELSPESYGWSGAYNTHFWVDPRLRLAAVFMSNLDNAGGAGSVTAFEFECNVMRSLRNA